MRRVLRWQNIVRWAVSTALKRLTTQWRSLLTIAVGVLLVSVIGASIPLYTATVAQVGLTQALQSAPPADVRIDVSYGSDDLTALDADWTTVDRRFRDLTAEHLGRPFPGWISAITAWGESTDLVVVRDGKDIEGVKAHAAYYENYRQALHLADGAWPADTAPSNADVEAVLSLDSARSLGVQVGDVMRLEQRGWKSSKPIRVRIAGIAAIQQTEALPLFYTTRAAYLRIMTEFVPEAAGKLGWHVQFDHARLALDDVPSALEALDALPQAIKVDFKTNYKSSFSALYETRLPDHLRDYQTRSGLLNAPLGVLLLQIGALVVFFVVTIAALVRRSERREIAILQSRGAQDVQVALWRGVETLILCAIGAAIGPFVAQGILIRLAPLLLNIDQLPLPLTSAAFTSSALAVGVAFIALMLTLRPVLRMPLIAAGGISHRAERQLWWQRYYVDVLFMVIGAAGLWRLISTRTPVSATTTGNGDIRLDWLLLIAPLFMLVALGSVLLRLFPTVTHLIAHFASRRDGLPLTLSAWQISREPVHYGRIAFLLALAIGIGWFGTSFLVSTRAEQSDQARYQVGADVRFNERNTSLKLDQARPEADYLQLPHVRSASTAFRLPDLNVSIADQKIVEGDVLAVHGESLARTVYWRDDMGLLPQPKRLTLPTPGLPLPSLPKRIGMLVKLENQPTGRSSLQSRWSPFLFSNYSLVIGVRLRDEAGTYYHIPMHVVQMEGLPRDDRLIAYLLQYLPSFEGNTSTEVLQRIQPLLARLTGWASLEGDLSQLNPPPQGRLNLECIDWDFPLTFSPFNGERALIFADLRLLQAHESLLDGAGQRLNWLDSTDQWSTAQDRTTLLASNTRMTLTRQRPGLRVSWIAGGDGHMGLMLNYPDPGPVSAIVSRSFAELNKYSEGGDFSLFMLQTYVPFKVQAIVDYFPTLYGQTRPFVVADRDALLYLMNRRPSAVVYASEVWLKLDQPDAALDSLQALGKTSQAQNIKSLDTLLSGMQSDLMSVGLLGLMFLGFLVALALSVFSLVTYTVLTTRARLTEFAVLRSLGWSPGRLVFGIGLEQLLVMAVAVVLGALLGAALSTVVLPTLASSTLGATEVVPPFRVQVSAALIAQYSLAIGLVFGAVLALCIVIVRQMSVVRALRASEE